jgi:hypothetical protein
MRGSPRRGLARAWLPLALSLLGASVFALWYGSIRCRGAVPSARLRVQDRDQALVAGADPRDVQPADCPPPQRTIDWTRVFRIGPDRWTCQKWLTDGSVIGDQYLKVLKNGKRYATLAHDDPAGCIIAVRRMTAPTHYAVLVVRCHSACGHGQNTVFYGIRRGRLWRMGTAPHGECGGPLFRDMDGDGRPEWVFDDDDWYTYYGRGPQHFVVYKLDRSGRLRRWKRLANRDRRALPDTVGIECRG